MSRSLRIGGVSLSWWHALHLVGVLVLVTYWSTLPAVGADVDNFWNVDPADPYVEPWGGQLAYVYSPAFAQAIWPLTLLPFDLFYRAWTAISIAALAWLITPFGAAVALVVPLVRTEVEGGQIHLWLAVMCALGVRYPGAWSFGLLTKVTPGIGLAWFAARREWRALGVGVAVTAGIGVLSAAFAVEAWRDWWTLLVESSTLQVGNLVVSAWPALFRVPIAAGLVVMAGWRGRPAALPLIVCFALPAIWPWSLTLAAAIPRLAREQVSPRGTT